MRTSLAFRYCIMIMCHFQCAHRGRARRSTRSQWRRSIITNTKWHNTHSALKAYFLSYIPLLKFIFLHDDIKDNTARNPNTLHANRDNKTQVGSIDLIGKYVDYHGIFTLRDVGMFLLLISLHFIAAQVSKVTVLYEHYEQ